MVVVGLATKPYGMRSIQEAIANTPSPDGLAPCAKSQVVASLLAKSASYHTWQALLFMIEREKPARRAVKPICLMVV